MAIPKGELDVRPATRGGGGGGRGIYIFGVDDATEKWVEEQILKTETQCISVPYKTGMEILGIDPKLLEGLEKKALESRLRFIVYYGCAYLDGQNNSRKEFVGVTRSFRVGRVKTGDVDTERMKFFFPSSRPEAVSKRYGDRKHVLPGATPEPKEPKKAEPTKKDTKPAGGKNAGSK